MSTCRTVLVLSVAGFSLSASAQSSRATADSALTRFIVRVENVSSSRTLKLSSGGSVAIPTSPGVWVVHSGSNPMFTPGKIEAGLGLKGLAEAGMADGLAGAMQKLSGVKAAGVFDTPLTSAAGASDGATSPLLMPGQRFEFTVGARPGDRLSLAMMNGESNDGLIATGANGIALFDATRRPVSGNVTSQLALWDAGTEANEDPGLGRNQGLRQGAPHAGDPERKPVRLMSEAEFGRNWPEVARMVRVTIEPQR